MLIFLYNLALFILLLPAILALAVLNRRRLRKESFYKWPERLGFWDFSKIDRNGKPVLWFHCASLGEVKAIEPLIRSFSGFSLVITVMTYSAHKYAEEKGYSNAVYYLPLDFSFLVNKVIKGMRPSALVLVETEIWPGLLHAAYHNDIKIITINGRLSVYSYPYYRLMWPLWQRVLSKIDIVSVRTAEDADRFIGLGCPVHKIWLTGNIKYDAFFHMPEVNRKTLGFKDSDLIWVAGSTRDGEEEALINVWIELKDKYRGLKLVIAPRHIERTGEISKLLERYGIAHTLYTDKRKNDNGCMLIDAFGELQKYYSVSDIVYVGGSLVNTGGQNPIEPAALSKPVVYGVYMQNFSEEARSLENSGGSIQVKNPVELLRAIDRLAGDREYRVQTGMNARKAVEKQMGAVERTVDIIKRAVN